MSGTSVDSTGKVYVYPVFAKATMVLEGEKALYTYEQEEFE